MEKRTVLAEVEGWLPIIDRITRDHGLITAAVFGVIWRHCQMRDMQCTASHDRLAGLLGLSKRSVIRHAQILVDNGYLSASHRDGETIIYRDTGKAGMAITISVTHGGGDRESQGGVTESHGWGDRESWGGVTESHPNTLVNTLINISSGGGSDEPDAAVFRAYETNIGALTPMLADKIDAAIRDYSCDWIIAAIEIAVIQEKRSWAYIEGILRRWKRDGFNTDTRHKKQHGKAPAEPGAFAALRQLESEGFFDE